MHEQNASTPNPDVSDEVQGGDVEMKVPFILQYLVDRKGAMSSTTSGTWSDMDASDYN